MAVDCSESWVFNNQAKSENINTAVSGDIQQWL